LPADRRRVSTSEREQAEAKDERRDGHRLERPRPAEHLEGVARVRRPPAELATLDQAEHEGPEASGDQEETREIEAESGPLFPRLADVVQRPRDGQETDRQVDEEGPPPRQVGGQEAAQERADRSHTADDGSPDPEGDRSIATLEVLVEDRLGGGQDHRPADALEDTGEDEHIARGSKARKHGGHDEKREPGQVHPATAEDVPQAPKGDQQGREDERVDRVDPLRLGRVEVQLADDRWDRDIHHRPRPTACIAAPFDGPLSGDISVVCSLAVRVR
jgi:hypothetical protein